MSVEKHVSDWVAAILLCGAGTVLGVLGTILSEMAGFRGMLWIGLVAIPVLLLLVALLAFTVRQTRKHGTTQLGFKVIAAPSDLTTLKRDSHDL